jgi:hypothetical protein
MAQKEGDSIALFLCDNRYFVLKYFYETHHRQKEDRRSI